MDRRRFIRAGMSSVATGAGLNLVTSVFSPTSCSTCGQRHSAFFCLDKSKSEESV